MKVTVIGCGRLGAPYACSLAAIGHDVLGVEVSPAVLGRLSQGFAPFDEQGLGEAIAEHHGLGRLKFTGSYEEAAVFADVHFVCVPTPQQDGGLGADLSAIESAVISLASRASGRCLIVGKSSVPVGTAARMGQLAAEHAPGGAQVTVAWSPDFLRESTSLADATRPTRIIVGLPKRPGRAEATLRRVWAPWTEAGVPLVVADLATAELAKSAANAFLATKVSFINAMAALCEASGADIHTLADSLSHDPRIGSAMLDSGLGFGGSCIPKDIRALIARGKELGVPEVSFLHQIDAINIRRRRRVVALARQACDGNLAGRRIALWGAAFKPGTDDVRDSPALAVAADLHAAGASVAVHDPKALPTVRRQAPELECVDDFEQVLDGADLLLHLTHWRQYADADPALFLARPAQHRVVDARGTLDARRWTDAGWAYQGLGYALTCPTTTG